VNTPDWSKAPIDATNYGTDTPNWGEGWYKLENGKWLVWWTAPSTREWSPVSIGHESWPERESSLIPRPTQWRGPQDGLPPVGCIVEVIGPNTLRINPSAVGSRVKIIAHEEDFKGDKVAVCMRHAGCDTIFFANTCEWLRPIQSDRDRVISEMCAVVSSEPLRTYRQSCEALYDAGYRKP